MATATKRTPLAAGTWVVGRYEVVKLLSDVGGFSLTYLVRDSYGRQFVLKELFPKKDFSRGADNTVIPDNEEAARKFERRKEEFRNEGERLRAQGVGHPNIAKTHELIETFGTCYLVSDYIDGQPLSKERARGGVLPEANQIMEWMTDLTGALLYLHTKHHICHCDVKPDNVMVEDGRLKLIDFGSARFYGRNQKLDHDVPKFRSGGYSAPEMYDNSFRVLKEEDGVKVDVYSLGATLYYLLKGQDPKKYESGDKDESSLMEALSEFDNGEYSLLSATAKEALRLNRKDRLKDMTAFARMLGLKFTHSVSNNNEVVTEVEEVPTEEDTPETETIVEGEVETEVEEKETETREEKETETREEKETETKEEKETGIKKYPKTQGNNVKGGGGGTTSWVNTDRIEREKEIRRKNLRRRIQLSVLWVVLICLIGLGGYFVYDRYGHQLIEMMKSVYTPGGDPKVQEGNEPVEPTGPIGWGADECVQTPVAEEQEEPLNSIAPGHFEMKDGNEWDGEVLNGEPNGRGKLIINRHTQIGDTHLYKGWVVENATFDDGIFLSGVIYDERGDSITSLSY